MARYGCAQFSAASNQFLYAPSDATLQSGGGDFTFGAWVQFDSAATDQILLTKGDGVTVEYSLTYFASLGLVLCSVGDGSGGDATAGYLGGNVMSAGTWYLVLAWLTGGNLHYSVNDAETTPAAAAFSAFQGSNSLAVGRSTTGSRPLDGKLGPIFLYHRALTPTERTALYNGSNGILPSALPSGLVPASGAGEAWDMTQAGPDRPAATNGHTLIAPDAGGPLTPTLVANGPVLASNPTGRLVLATASGRLRIAVG